MVSPQLELGPVAADGWRDFALKLEIRDGWHLGAELEAGPALHLEGLGVELGELDLPEAGRPGLAGEIAARGRLREQSTTTRRAIRLRYQPCSGDRCLPSVAIELSVPE